MRTLLMAAALALMPLSASADPLPRIPCEVDRVLDGDTFTAACYAWPGMLLETKVRVLGIDTPERGWRASCEDEALLADLATDAAHVLLEDGRDYGTEMMRRGLALPYAERAAGWC